jgi:hypothetical protein
MSSSTNLAAAQESSPIGTLRRDSFVRSDGTRGGGGSLGVREGIVRASSDETLARRRVSNSPKAPPKSWRHTLTRRRPSEPAEPVCCVKYSSKGLSTCQECGKSW